MIGQTIDGRYTIRDLLDQGPAGERYEAEDTTTGETVQVQVGLPARQGDVREQFAARVRALENLSHPDLPGILDSGWYEENPYLVLIVRPGRPLPSEASLAPLPVERVLYVGRQVLSLLAYIHGEGVVHGDMRPPNILLAPTMGFPDVMLTGYALNDRGSKADDVRGVAVAMYELLTGQTPEVDGSGPRAAELNRKVPAALDDLLAGLLSSRAGPLAGDANAVLEQLLEIGEQIPGKFDLPEEPGEPSNPPSLY